MGRRIKCKMGKAAELWEGDCVYYIRNITVRIILYVHINFPTLVFRRLKGWMLAGIIIIVFVVVYCTFLSTLTFHFEYDCVCICVCVYMSKCEKFPLDIFQMCMGFHPHWACRESIINFVFVFRTHPNGPSLVFFLSLSPSLSYTR